MSNFLEQAEAAAQNIDGYHLKQSLQQLLNSENWAAMTPGHQATCLDQFSALALAVLTTGDFQVRWQVAKMFPLLEKAAKQAGASLALAPLIEILQDNAADWELRWFVTRILGNLAEPEGVIALVNLIQTTADEELREAAATALANVGTAAVQALSELLFSPATSSRLLAVQALSQIRRAETIPPLLRVVDDPDLAIRVTATEALSSFHDPRIPPVLVKALADPAAQVRCVAVAGLGMRSDLLRELGLVNLLAPLLWDLNLEVCQQAAIALGRLQTPAAAAALIRALKSRRPPIPLQISIVRALGWALTPSVLTALQQALTFVPQPVQQEIVRAIAQTQGSSPLTVQATEVLLALLAAQGAGEPGFKQTIAVGLAELGEPQAMPALIDLLADPELGVRLHAIAALKKLDSQAAYTQIKALYHQPDLSTQLRQGLELALQEWQR